MLPENQIVRPDILAEAIKMHIDYLKRVTKEDGKTIQEFVTSIFQNRYKPKKAVYNITTSPGNEKVMEGDLYKLLKKFPNKVIAPAGTFYKPTVEQPSFISQMVVDKLKERKKVKKKQLEAEAVGDDLEAKRCWYQQATIKINCNSLPGGFGSPFNIFYDKPGYNSITSPARCMIARAYTIAEQLLGGNFAWFSDEELINHILLNLKQRPSDDQIKNTIQKYKLKMIDGVQLMDFYTDTLRRYCPWSTLGQIHRLVNTLNELEITYLFYYCNLRHIMWYNEDVFKGYIHYVFDTSKVKIDPNVTAEDVKKLDDTVLAVTTVGLAHEFNNYSIKVIIEEHPELIHKLVGYCKSIEHKLHVLDQLFDTFVNTDADVPEVRKKSGTWRNTVIISDTDSEIFTATEWDDWYRGGVHYNITESICSTSLEFIENFIKNDVLYPAMEGKLSAQKLIDKVVGWERHIYDSIKHGETEFLQITSLKYEREYKNPESTSVYFAWLFWQSVYAQKYGDVQPPAKVVYISLYSPTQGYYEWLEGKNKTIYKKTLEFVGEKGKFPSNLLINPASNKIPEEIIPLVDHRKIIYHNCAPLYQVMEKLNIGVAHISKEVKTLLMDLYG